nr:glycerol-3-phosphate dehydrogenase/oxidase [uncultured Bacillus sp.]
MVNFSGLERQIIQKEMIQSQYDILVIGGGITGCGIALDAVTRGMNTCLVEMQDFSSGTSSRSTKLVHGGLRYLKQFQFKLVAEVGRERAIVYENGPHVTTPQWMLLPIYEGGSFGFNTMSIALWLYDCLAGVKKDERRKMLSYVDTLRKEPLLKRKGLKGGGYYIEYRTDDARLTIEVIKEAAAHGVKALNYVKALEFFYEQGKIAGARVEDQLTGECYKINAKKVIHAAGPWIDRMREKDHLPFRKKLLLTKGVHLVFDSGKFPLQQAVYFDTHDGRMVFAIPRDGKIYVGTTDTLYEMDPIDPRMNVSDRSYLLKVIQGMFPDLCIHEADVESSWAGVRPLIYEEGKSPSELSRKDEIWVADSGLLTIAGGKLTGYRKMAENVVNVAAQMLEKEEGLTFKPCQTKKLPVSGGHFGGSHLVSFFVEKHRMAALSAGITEEQYMRLVHRYGTNINHIIRIAHTYDPQTCYTLPLDVYAEVLYAIEYEMIVKPADFFIRRTGALFFQINGARRWKKAVIELMSDAFDWSEKEKERYEEEFALELEKAAEPAEEMQ